MHIVRHPQLNAPPEVCIVIITATTPSKMLTARKVTMRNIRIFLDSWYMACNRVMMMTCSMFQSSHWVLASTKLTPQHCNYHNTCPIQCGVYNIAWRIQSVTSPGWHTLQKDSHLWKYSMTKSLGSQEVSKKLHSPLQSTTVNWRGIVGICAEDSLYLSAKCSEHWLYSISQKKPRWRMYKGDIPSTARLIVRDRWLAQHRLFSLPNIRSI
jgi:hypothetical protein